jgi:hypothetical protein
MDSSDRNESLFNAWTYPKGIILNLFMLMRYNKFMVRKNRIDTFIENSMQISAMRYHSSSDLERDVSQYDVLICGSDQVWRPNSNYDRNRAYFLGFAQQDQAIKISYAPSFGVSSIPPLFKEDICPWINSIPNLSIREETGRSIIEQVTGRRATVVLDPTLLLEANHWEGFVVPPAIKTPYILVYSTSQRGLFSELVQYVKKTTRLPIVVLSLYSLNLISGADEVIYDAGPREFISLFANAECVCTNSFHGSAFSIIFHKPFWSVPHNMANSRLADLLQRIGLGDRQVDTTIHFPSSPLEIDYGMPRRLLERERLNSLKFLESALSPMQPSTNGLNTGGGQIRI